MALSKIKERSIEDAAITTAKIADNAVATAKIADNAVSGAKFSGQAGVSRPTVTGATPVIAPSTATAVTITGTNFKSDSTHVPIVEAVNSTGGLTRATVVSWASATSLAATFSLAQGDYRVRVENPDGGAALSTNAILQSSQAPTWTTAAGSLGTFSGGATISVTVAASSDSDVDYSKVSGTYPGGISLAAETGVLSGTESGSSVTTTYEFTLKGTDEESQDTANRTFSITISHGATGGGQFN